MASYERGGQINGESRTGKHIDAVRAGGSLRPVGEQGNRFGSGDERFASRGTDNFCQSGATQIQSMSYLVAFPHS